MAKFKFGDKIKTQDGKEGVVQEDQEESSTEVKVLFEGDGFAHVIEEDQLQTAQ